MRPERSITFVIKHITNFAAIEVVKKLEYHSVNAPYVNKDTLKPAFNK